MSYEDAKDLVEVSVIFAKAAPSIVSVIVAVKERFLMFSKYVEKEIKRGSSLEALEYYRTIMTFFTQKPR